MAAGDLETESRHFGLPFQWAMRGLTLVAILAAIPTYLAFGARWWWVLELATHYRAYYVLGLVPIAILLVIFRRWKLFIWVTVALGINLLVIAPLYAGAPGQDGRRSLRLLSANVLSTNPQHDRLIRLIHQETPDVIVLLEVNDSWNESLSALSAEYPYSIIEPQKGSFGIALFSKLPAESLEITGMGGNDLPSVKATLLVDDSRLYLLATHPPPPMSSEMADQRNQQLAALANDLVAAPDPRLLVGDLNITPWSPYFQDLLQQGNLKNSQQGFGIQATWFAKLPIDHLLYSDGLTVLKRRIGPQIGSDHRPLIVDLAVDPATK